MFLTRVKKKKKKNMTEAKTSEGILFDLQE